MPNLLQKLMAEIVEIPKTPGVLIRRSDLHIALKNAGFGPKSLDLLTFAPRAVDGEPATFAPDLAAHFGAFLLEEHPEYAH